ncbi:hypothetical protein ACWEO4_18605 [Streptomyces sp. NPDC004393]
MLLRLAYLTITNVFAALRLLPMSDRDKDAEILALRHQLMVLERQLGTDRVKFTSQDRAFLAALLVSLPVPFRNALLQVVWGLVVLRAAWDDAAGDCLAGLSGDEEAVVGPGVAAAPAGGQGRRASCPAVRERGAA